MSINIWGFFCLFFSSSQNKGLFLEHHIKTEADKNYMTSCHFMENKI